MVLLEPALPEALTAALALREDAGPAGAPVPPAAPEPAPGVATPPAPVDAPAPERKEP